MFSALVQLLHSLYLALFQFLIFLEPAETAVVSLKKNFKQLSEEGQATSPDEFLSCMKVVTSGKFAPLGIF